MIHKLVDPAANASMYGGAVMAVTFWGLQLGDVAAMTSAVVAVLGFVVHFWATWRRDRRDKERHQLTMEALRSGSKTADTHTGAGNP